MKNVLYLLDEQKYKFGTYKQVNLGTSGSSLYLVGNEVHSSLSKK